MSDITTHQRAHTASWLLQLDRIERKLDQLLKALAEDEEPQGTLDESEPVAQDKLQGM